MNQALLCKLPQNLSAGQPVVGDFSGSVGPVGGIWAPEGFQAQICTPKPPLKQFEKTLELGSDFEGSLEDLVLSWGV